MDKKIRVCCSVRQVRDGIEYEGTLLILGALFVWRLVLAVPISQFDSKDTMAEIIKKGLSLFGLTLYRREIPVELDGDEFLWFGQIIIGLVFQFYLRPGTRLANQGVMGWVLRHRGSSQLSAEVSRSEDIWVDYEPHIRQIMSDPKFGFHGPVSTLTMV